MIIRSTLSLTLSLVALSVLSACGASESSESKRAPVVGQDDVLDGGKGKKPKAGATDSGDDETSGDDGSDGGGAGSSDGVDGGDGDDGSGDGGGSLGLGRKVFDERVLAYFQVNCVSCHADPRIPVDLRGPLSVYSYDKMKAFLVDGSGSTSNALLDKITGVTSHGGGNRCAQGLTASPCKDVTEWWIAEMGPDDGGGSGAARGAVSDVTALGKVYGWAADPAEPTAILTVRFYLDGEAGTGTMIGEMAAGLAGQDGGTAGNHAFIWELPATARDKKAHELFAYALIDGKEEPLLRDGFAFTAYAFSDAGRTFYQNTVQGQLGACQACHTVSYEQQFFSLIAPAPNKGGTAGNNQMLNKPAQINGATHGGGQRCGSATTGVCAAIQQWWALEFGP